MERVIREDLMGKKEWVVVVTHNTKRKTLMQYTTKTREEARKLKNLIKSRNSVTVVIYRKVCIDENGTQWFCVPKT